MSSDSFAGGQNNYVTPSLPATAPFEAYIHEVISHSTSSCSKHLFRSSTRWVVLSASKLLTLIRILWYVSIVEKISPCEKVENNTGGTSTGEEWVAGSIFVASDHLVHILAKNMYTRNKADGGFCEGPFRGIFFCRGCSSSVYSLCLGFAWKGNAQLFQMV